MRMRVGTGRGRVQRYSSGVVAVPVAVAVPALTAAMPETVSPMVEARMAAPVVGAACAETPDKTTAASATAGELVRAVSSAIEVAVADAGPACAALVALTETMTTGVVAVACAVAGAVTATMTAE